MTGKGTGSRDVASYLLSAALLIAGLVRFGIEEKTFAFLIAAATFALMAFALRGVTLTGAAMGLSCCFVMQCRIRGVFIIALVVVFVLTYLATRFRGKQKKSAGIVQDHLGRDGLQVFANLGAASVILLFNKVPWGWLAACAVLAEAAADTVSSEVGKALNSRPRLLTSWAVVHAGTNGAISAIGTLVGIIAAAFVAIICVELVEPWKFVPHIWLEASIVAAVLGMFFDSLLGATLENRRWLNNDAVNFLSTCFAAAVADGLLWVANHLH